MRKTILFFLAVGLLAIVYYSCSKGGDSNYTDPCAGVTVSVNGSVTNASSGQSNGSITATATGGSGFSFSLNNGAFQSSGTFGNLAAGSYTIVAKNSNGCTGSKSFTVVATNNCTGVNITISTTTTTTATPCGGPGGSIAVTASGSSGLTFSMDNGAFQAGTSFTNVTAGDHTIIAKDANGCTQSASVNVAAAPAGPLFSAVRSILQNNCVSCHNNSVQNGGMNWAVDCNIVTNKARIKARAVDEAGTATQMPQPPNAPLSTTDRQKIVDWINAGGTYSN